jgi:hypothetical protein
MTDMEILEPTVVGDKAQAPVPTEDPCAGLIKARDWLRAMVGSNSRSWSWSPKTLPWQPWSATSATAGSAATISTA